MTEKTLTTENIKPALDALRGELAPWPVVAKKQDRLNTAQLNAANSGITSSLVAQIIANTAAIRALESAITGTGLRALVVASLPAVGTTGILYIVPVTTYDPDTDADVVNYSNEYIWIPVEGGTASEGHYEQVGQTGIVINNGQLTITVNGTSVGTFTANQSGDTTAAITVPTNSDYVDLTTAQTAAGVKTFSDGIVGNVTGTASKAIADADGNTISSTYGKLAGSQTWTGSNKFTDTLTFKNNDVVVGATTGYGYSAFNYVDSNNSSIAYHRVSKFTSGNTCLQWKIYNTNNNSESISAEIQYYLTKTGERVFTPNSNGDTTLGTSSYRWSAVYADSYYYGTTSFTDKFVTIDTTQTITANKGIATYNATLALHNTQIEIGTAPANQRNSEIFFGDKNYAELGRIMYRAATDGTRLMWLAINDKYANGALSPTGTNKWNNFFIRTDPTGYRTITFDTDAVIPDTNNISLGTSTNKWKTLNGINPGALSLPDISNSVSIDIPNTWVTDGSAWNSLNVSNIGDGWLCLTYRLCGANDYIIARLGGSSGNSYPSMIFSATLLGDSKYYLYAFIPITKAMGNVCFEIKLTSGSVMVMHSFFPASGNV